MPYDIPTPPPHPEKGPAPAAPPPPADADGPDPLLVEGIAYAAHEVNRVLQIMDADPAIPVSPHWDDLDEHTRNSAIDGVRAILAEGLTPEQSHENWVRFKAEDGWTWGKVKDAEAKTHPNMVPYDELPEAQRRKDHVFHGIVRLLSVQERTEVIAGFLAVVDENGRSIGVIDPRQVVNFSFRREADLNDVHRVSTELAKDALLSMTAQVTTQVAAPHIVRGVIEGQMQVAQQISSAQQEAEIRKKLLLDQKGGHRQKGGRG